MNRRLLALSGGSLLLALLGVAFLSGFRSDLNPMIFVHGGSGSGAQFASQAMRFTSNGYPARYIGVVEYDSGGLAFPEDLPIVHAAIDARIAELLALTGRSRVDMLGHSRGTTVMHDYLSFPDRAAKVAHYVNIDGRSADAPPGGVPTLALWAGAVDRPVQGEIGGAINVTIPKQEHVEVATSAESFAEIYRFFRGHPPWTTEIVPQSRPRISGRAVSFPDNVGLEGSRLEVWRVDGSTGETLRRRPDALFLIAPDGSFGPFKARRGRHYKFLLRREGERPFHYFFEPFVRSDHLLRLNIAPLLDPFLIGSEKHTGMAIIRYREFWGDRGTENDVLAINGTDVINPITAPSGEVGAASVAFFVFDEGADRVSDVERVPFPFAFVSFLTGSDLFLPADPPGTISVRTVPRGDATAARTVNFPNLPSAESRIVVQLNDFDPPPPGKARKKGKARKMSKSRKLASKKPRKSKKKRRKLGPG